MIEGLLRDAGPRSAETSAWEWGPKVWGENALMFQIPLPSTFFPGIFSQDIQRDRTSQVKELQRTSIYQIGKFQAYFSHPQMTCALLPKATSQYPSWCTHCRPWWIKHLCLCPRACREGARWDQELQSWADESCQCCGYRTHNWTKVWHAHG